jgi:2,3-bisphosphoglycerate-independent phosphoglycerate mutase
MIAQKSEVKVLFIFLDGIGIGKRDSYNPFFAKKYPFLHQLLDGSIPTLSSPSIRNLNVSLVPCDATMGIDGLPQSGTGQAALYTGINTAAIVGRHFGPYLYSTIKPVIETFGLFPRLQRLGMLDQTALANAFPQRFFDYLKGSRRRMVAGMYMASKSNVEFRDIDCLKRAEAVSTDITAERWRDIGHPDAPVVSPYVAGQNLARISTQHRFTMFEYFRTDKPGHDMDMEEAIQVIGEVDEFLHGVFEAIQGSKLMVVIASDHGNLEDLSTKSHTRNPIPLISFGNGHDEFTSGMRSILDLTPALIRVLASGKGA